jgi:hypothetical protein
MAGQKSRMVLAGMVLLVGSRLAGTDEIEARIAASGGKTHSITALGFAPDGKTLAAAGKDRLLRLWQVPAENNGER